MGNNLLETLKKRAANLGDEKLTEVTQNYDAENGAGATKEAVQEHLDPGASSAPKIVHATEDNPVVELGTFEGEEEVETPKLEFSKDTYDNIRMKSMLDAKSITPEEREIAAKVQIKLADGESIDSIFGIENEKSSALSEIDSFDIAGEFSGVSLYKMRGELRQSGYSEAEIAQISDSYREYKQGEKDATSNFYKNNTSRIKQEAADITNSTNKYTEMRETAYKNADRAKKSAQRQASLSGVGRSSVTEEIMAGIESQTSALITQYDLSEQLEKERIRLANNNAEAADIQAVEEKLQSVRNNIIQSEESLDSITRENEEAMKEQYLEESKQILANSGIDESTVDMDITQQHGDGYYRNSEGKIVLGEDGMPVEYTSLETKEIEDEIDAFLEQYEGVSIPNSRAGMIAAIKQYKAQGYSLGDIMDSLNEEIQNSDDYLNQKNSDFVGVDEVVDFGDGKRVYYKDGTYEDLEVTKDTQHYSELKDGRILNKSTGKIMDVPSTKSANWMSFPDGYDCGVQCGQYARTAAGMTATPGGNSKEARFKAFSDTEAKTGGLVFFGGEGYDETYGHISIVESINEDGSINLVESNLAGDNKISRRTIQADEATGFYNDTPLAKTQNVDSFSPENEPMYKYFLNNGKLDSTDRKTFSDEEFTVFKKEAQNYRNKLNEEGSQQKHKVIAIAKALKEIDPGRIARLSANKGGAFVSGEIADYQATYDSLLANLTLDNLVELKKQGATFGALSEGEYAALQASATMLTAGLSDAKYTAEIDNIIDILSKNFNEENRTKAVSGARNTTEGETGNKYTW